MWLKLKKRWLKFLDALFHNARKVRVFHYFRHISPIATTFFTLVTHLKGLQSTMVFYVVIIKVQTILA